MCSFEAILLSGLEFEHTRAIVEFFLMLHSAKSALERAERLGTEGWRFPKRRCVRCAKK